MQVPKEKFCMNLERSAGMNQDRHVIKVLKKTNLARCRTTFLMMFLNPKQAGGSESMYSLGGRMAPPP